MTDIAASAPADPVRHRPLARTFSAARWQEYDKLLGTAEALGWSMMDLEGWVTAGGVGGRVLILRHDVDQHPATALTMARIEARHGVRATWYFRWRTGSPLTIRRIRELGGGVGFHYETLTRLVHELDLRPDEISDDLIAAARDELRREVATFELHFGALKSICAHGDTRVPGVSNQLLVRNLPASHFGVAFDANEALGRHHLDLWLTDRSRPDGGWAGGTDPTELLQQSEGPLLCLTHPNNWCSGASLWSDRFAHAVLPKPSLDKARWRIGIRTGSDQPPPEGMTGVSARELVATPAVRAAPTVLSFAPIAESLRREIIRYYYDLGESLVADAGIRTLETNSGLAEARAATLEYVLLQARAATIRDRDVADLGCGFGALSLVFAARGARVTALDPNAVRLTVGAHVAEQFGLGIEWIVGGMDTVDPGHSRFDVAIMNNSFCYVVERASRQAALTRTLEALRPGGVLVVRNPNRLRLRDQFTGLPLLGLLPPQLAALIGRLLHRNRSAVRLQTVGEARRELRAAGFVAVRSVATPGVSRLAVPFAAYHHLVARRPGL